MKATDMLGQEYGVGDYVVYATTSGRSPVLKYARVETVKEVEDPRLAHRVVNTVLKVGVREIANGRGFGRWDSHKWKDGVMVETPVRVTYPMVVNIVKVNVNGAE